MADHHHNSNSTGGFFSNIFRSLVHRRNDSENHEQNINDVEMSSNYNDTDGEHDATTRIPTVTVDDSDDNEMPPLQDVSDTEDEGEDDIYLNSTSIPPSSEVSNAPSPMTQGSSSVPSPLPGPRRAGQRRARVDDDDDQERDRRHPSQRVNDNSNSNSPSVNDNNNTQPRQHPSISVSIDLGPGPPGPIPIPINAGVPFPGHRHHHNHDHEGEDNAGRPLHGISFMEFMNRRFPMPPQPPPANPNPPPAEGQQPHRHIHPPFPGTGGIVVPLPVAALPGLFRALSSSLHPPDANVPPPGPDIFTLFGGLGGLTEEREDTAKGQQVVDGLEAVPPGLVKRLARVNKELGEGEDGMDGAGCAICWEKLISDDAEDVTEKQVEVSSSSDDAQAAPTTDETSSESSKPLQTTPDENANKIVSLPCTHTFHAACLIPWFSRPRQTTCPVCRFDLDPEGLVWGMSRSRRMGGIGGGMFGMNDFMRMFGGPPTAAGPNPEPPAGEAGNDVQGEGQGEGTGQGAGQPDQRGGPTGQVVRDLLELGRVLGLGREGPTPTQPTPARERDAPGTAQATPNINTAEQASQASNVSDPAAHGTQATPAPSSAEAQPEAANTGNGTGDQPGDDQLREMVHRFVSGLFGGVGGVNQPNIRVMNTGRTGGPIQVIIDMPPRRQGGEEPAAPATGAGAVPPTPATTGDNINNTTQQTQPQPATTGTPNGANPPQPPLAGPVFSIGFDMIIGGPPPPGFNGDGFGFGIPIPLPRAENHNNSNNTQPPPNNNDDDDLEDLPPLADMFDMFLRGGPPLHEDRVGNQSAPNAGDFLDMLRRDMERQPNNNQRNARSQSPPSDIDSDGDVIMVEPVGFDDDDEEFELSLAREERRVLEARQASSAQQNENTTGSSSQFQPSSSPRSSPQEHQRPHVHRHSIPGGYVSMVTGTADSMDDAMRQIMDAVGGPPPPYAMPRRPPPSVSDPPRGVRERRGMSIPIPVPPFMRTSTTPRPLNNNDRRPSAQVPSFLSSLGSRTSLSSPSSTTPQHNTQEHSRQRSGESRERRRLSGVHVPNVFAPWMNIGSSRRTSLSSSSAPSSTVRPTQSSSFPSSNSSPQLPTATPRPAGPSSSGLPQPQAQPSSGARPRPRHRPYSPPPPPPLVDLDDDAPMSFSQFLRTTALPRAPPPRRRTRPAPAPPQRPEPKKWSAPLPPGLTLRERIEKKEREAGLRCADPSCGIGPSDDEPFSEGQRKQIGIRAKKSIKGKEKEEERGAEYVCDHAFHPSCLVSAHRVAMSMYARDEEDEAVGDEVDVECSICRHEGVVGRSVWEEGVKG